MTISEYGSAAVQLVIDLAASKGLKYRYLDFGSPVEELPELHRNSMAKNTVTLIGGGNPKGVRVILSADCPRMGQRIKQEKDKFLDSPSCRVISHGSKAGVSFFFAFEEIDRKDAKGLLMQDQDWIVVIAAELIREQQEKLEEYTAPWTVGEQLKDICRDPHCAAIVVEDLCNPSMSLEKCEEKIHDHADENQRSSKRQCVCVTPIIAERIIREFYGLLDGAAQDHRG